jgi:hypothetical protein
MRRSSHRSERRERRLGLALYLTGWEGVTQGDIKDHLLKSLKKVVKFDCNERGSQILDF